MSFPDFSRGLAFWRRRRATSRRATPSGLRERFVPGEGVSASVELERRELMATLAVVDNSQPAFAPGAFASTSSFGGFSGNFAFSSGANTTGTWTFTGLDPGVYEVGATWVPAATNGGTVPFTISTGGAPQVVPVNQKVAPAADMTNTGFNFKRISNGILVDASGTMTVSITDAGAGGFAIADAVLANRVTAVTGLILDNTSPSFTTGGSFSNNIVVAGSFGGSIAAAPAAPPSVGTWVYTGLTPGKTYQVSLTWPVAPTNASNTPISISDGLGTTVTALVNQKIAPAANVTDAGANFQIIAQFVTVGGTQLFVGVGNQSADGFVIADAVRIVEVIPPSSNIVVTDGVAPLTSGVSTVNLGATPFGVAVTKTITIQNTGGLPLNLGTVAVVGAGFTVTQPVTPIVAPGGNTTFTVNMPATAAGSYSGVVTIPSNDPDTPAFTFNVAGVVNPPPYPTVSGVSAKYGTKSVAAANGFTASWINFSSLVLQFTQNVAIDPADIRLTNFAGQTVPVTLSYNPATFAATLQFSAALPVNRYTLVVDGDDAASDGNVGVNSGGLFLNGGIDFVFQFNVLPGDVNGDGFVNMVDVQVASAAATSQSVNGIYSPFADVNGDGVVNAADQSAIRSRIGTRLP